MLLLGSIEVRNPLLMGLIVILLDTLLKIFIILMLLFVRALRYQLLLLLLSPHLIKDTSLKHLVLVRAFCLQCGVHSCLGELLLEFCSEIILLYAVIIHLAFE